MLNTFSSAISPLLDQRMPGHALPAGLYTREDVFKADLDVFFRRHWIYVGLECDVPEPGDAHVIDLGSSSIILLRDDDSQIRVLHNVCRHRGARLLDSGTSIVSKLVCPYHQWTYELDGELAYAPHMGTSFDKTCKSLKPVHFRSIGGLLYVCLSEAVARRLVPLAPKRIEVAAQPNSEEMLALIARKAALSAAKS